MKDIYDLKGKLLDYIKEGHINKDTLISNLFDYLNEAELEDFAVMYNYIDEDEELLESSSDFTNNELRIIRDTVNKFYPEYRGKYIARFLNDVSLDRLPKDCYVDLEDEKERGSISDAEVEKMITIDSYDMSSFGNVFCVSLLNPKDGKIYRYADF